jgi:hypothetical protein
VKWAFATPFGQKIHWSNNALIGQERQILSKYVPKIPVSPLVTVAQVMRGNHAKRYYCVVFFPP